MYVLLRQKDNMDYSVINKRPINLSNFRIKEINKTLQK